MSSPILLELSEEDAAFLLSFARGHASSDGHWGETWREIARSIEQGAEWDGKLCYQDFLRRILEGSDVQYGKLIWDGQSQQVITSLHFELDKHEPKGTVNQRAYDFLSDLAPHEYLTHRIAVDVRNFRAVRGEMEPLTNVVKFGTGRLMRLAEQYNLPKK